MTIPKGLTVCFAVLIVMAIWGGEVEAVNNFQDDGLKIFSSSLVFTQGCVCLKGLEPEGVKLFSYLCGMASGSGCDIKNSDKDIFHKGLPKTGCFRNAFTYDWERDRRNNNNQRIYRIIDNSILS